MMPAMTAKQTKKTYDEADADLDELEHAVVVQAEREVVVRV